MCSFSNCLNNMQRNQIRIMCAAGAHTHLINEGRPNEGKQTSLYKLMPCTANSHTQKVRTQCTTYYGSIRL